jgi:glyoxylase-like metal-dependent hydrolase (beta-lactamase superfamily II)
MNPADAWTDLGDGILVRQSRAFAMNSVLLLAPEQAVVVDPGVLPSELDDLAAVVSAAECEAVTLFFTHAHWDHVLGRPWWPGARTLAHDRCGPEMRAERASILREAEAIAAAHGERWTRGFEPFRIDQAVSGLKFLRLDPWRLVLRDAPGHSASQLTAHLADHGLLIAADMLSDIEPPILDGPPGPYRQTLTALEVLADNGAIETLIPGHGAIARGREAVRARFRTDLGYLDALETGAREAARRGLSLDAAQEMLAAMDYTAKHTAPEWVGPLHKENIRVAFEAVVSHR